MTDSAAHPGGKLEADRRPGLHRRARRHCVPTAANVAPLRAASCARKRYCAALASTATEIASSGLRRTGRDVDEFLERGRAQNRKLRAPHPRLVPHRCTQLTHESLKIIERLYEGRKGRDRVPHRLRPTSTASLRACSRPTCRDGGAPLDGQDGARAQHRAYAATEAEPASRRLLLAGNVRGAAGAAAVVLGGSSR